LFSLSLIWIFKVVLNRLTNPTKLRLLFLFN
jgi:hypothetical protein